MDVVIETCVKYAGGPTRTRETDIFKHRRAVAEYFR
jgi:hypothetical protein